LKGVFLEEVELVNWYDVFDRIRIKYEVENIGWILEINEEILEL